MVYTGVHQQVSFRFDYAFIFIYILGNIRCGSSGKEKTVFSICLFSHLSLSLRTVPTPMSLLGETGGWGTTYLLERRLLDALILTVPNFATSNPVVDKATVDALVVCI